MIPSKIYPTFCLVYELDVKGRTSHCCNLTLSYNEVTEMLELRIDFYERDHKRINNLVTHEQKITRQTLKENNLQEIVNCYAHGFAYTHEGQHLRQSAGLIPLEIPDNVEAFFDERAAL